MKFENYKRTPKNVRAIKITDEVLFNPDCHDGQLQYTYRDNTWYVSTTDDPETEGQIGDYIVEHEEDLYIINGDDFEEDYQLVVPVKVKDPDDRWDYLNYPG